MVAEPKVRLDMYANMVTSRYYEESIANIYMEGKQPKFDMAEGPIPGEMHLSNGQEPVAAGVCAHLERGDVVTATHRPHHIAIAKGVDLNRMSAEIFGKRTGLSGGRGGHMHIFDIDVNFVCSGIVAQGMGPAAGAALASKMKNLGAVAISFIGEGAANQGAFHEVMNLAAVWNLPFVCVIEDNAWAVSVGKNKSTAVPHNHVRAAAYGIPGELVQGNDPDKVYAVAGTAIQQARDGGGPTLIEVETTRLAGHFIGDAEGYRAAGEQERNEANDPIARYRTTLLDAQVCSEAELDKIVAEAHKRVDDAIAFARDSAEPDAEDALRCVFVGGES